MDQQDLSSRAIVGMYYAPLEADEGADWLEAISNAFGSDQSGETYKFLGQSPTMREWVGGRQAKGFSGQGITILNTHYESTIEVQKKDARRDKTGQLRARIEEWRGRHRTHWASLLSTLLLNAGSALCYDGDYFFGTAHVEGASGTQSNKITVDISEVPATLHGTTTNPSVQEMQHAMIKAIVQVLSFKDDQGEPMNEEANSFLFIVPMGLYMTAVAAVTTLATASLAPNLNPNILANLNISVRMNVRLSSWTAEFVCMRTDSPIKALIRQTEQEIELKAKAEGSEYEFDNDAWQFGVDGWRGVGYGYWQRACHVTLI